MALSGVKAAIHAAEAYLDTDAIPWKRIAVTLLCAVELLEMYLMLRQCRMYSVTTPPKVFEKHVSDEDFRKSQRYGSDMTRLLLLQKALGCMTRLGIILYNVDAHMWVASTALLRRLGVTPGEVMTTVVYANILSLIWVPQSIFMRAFEQWVVQAQRGSGMQSWLAFIVDTAKGLALGIVLSPLYALLIPIVRWTGDGFVAYAVLCYAAISVTGSVIYPTLIQPLFTSLTPLPDCPLRDRIAVLAEQVHLPLEGVYVIEESSRSRPSNAYVEGMWGRSQRIVLTDTLFQQLSPAEIEALLAQELGHWTYSHGAKMAAIELLYPALTLCGFTLFFKNAAMFRAFGFGPHAVARVPYLPVLVGYHLFNMLLEPLHTMLGPVINAVSRRFEFEADRFAVALSRPGPIFAQHEDADGSYAELLKRALLRLQIHERPTTHHDPLYSAYFHPAPTLPERWDAIDRMQHKSQ
ncbi:Ste24 endopeptidase [Malassezia caprae]|uniref:CAAX prenyl protease n=1 Tax=Malassezia caprae TaxID=1381934 RepID=A0AAF0IUE5_9BASI|nr:Ste24 endopeptidase [Malassezia caprae]